jgi:peptidoglycan/xylan/chitin deacetylase (PgdA/CDA1 family)
MKHWWWLILLPLSVAGLIVVRKNLPVKTGTIATNVAIITVTPTAVALSSAIPTIKAMSFEDMNVAFGPCTQTPVLMYHHIQEETAAKANGQASLSVTPEFFRKQMEYLKTKSYSVIEMKQLVDFFNNGIALPKKSVLITLDDGYEDNYTNAWPILKEYGFKATIFTPTGLVDNPDYFSWSQMAEMKDNIYFANHTWSHHSSTGTEAVLNKEIGMADTQLAEHGYNSEKIFAYPYGKSSSNDEKILNKYGYKLAFTTTYGRILCKAKRFDLPRVRIGNADLNKYGL